MGTYTIIRSNRKTASLQVKSDGQVVVRAPYYMPSGQIDEFVRSHEAWIARTRGKLLAAEQNRREITPAEREQGVQAALSYLPQRVAYYAARMGVNYGRITIREQKTRWGSCSSAGNLNFNWKLMLVPPELLDYVVVHELAHRREMNHSPQFWAIVEKELPDYRERRRRLKEINL
ncbi:MAG: M48 family metallopeptidase [Lachnospiraceae bacterium]|nr:M48 family metallopeptidase [Lachnospiraceae bacterium]